MGFTPSAGKELQSEFFVPRQHAVDAILAVERLRDQITPHLLITEIRAIAADNLWMSPCYKQSCVAIHFTWKQDWPAVSKVLPVIEKELAPYKARPHWGKLFTMSPATLKSRYERLARLSAIGQTLRPSGKIPQRLPEHKRFQRLMANAVCSLLRCNICSMSPVPNSNERSMMKSSPQSVLEVSSAIRCTLFRWLRSYAVVRQLSTQTSSRREIRGRQTIVRTDAWPWAWKSHGKIPCNFAAFLRKMPKGADLHNHLSGAIYAESFIRAAGEDGLCVDTNALAFAKPEKLPCMHAKGSIPAADVPKKQALYDSLIDSFSMRGFVPSPGVTGHDHFFNTFAKFGGTDAGTKASGLTKSPRAPRRRTSSISS